MAVLMLALLPWVAVATPTGREARAEERMERAEQRHRLRQVLELSNVLGLDNAQALKLERDPATIERVARERFGMIREGETLYRFVPVDSAAGAPKP